MSRSNWKTPFIDKSILKYLKKKQKKFIWSRRSTIYPAIVGFKLMIHNGNIMFSRKIIPEMVGHKLGELVPTRKSFVPKQSKTTILKKS